MTDWKTTVTRFRFWLRSFIRSGTTRRKQDRVRFIRPNLEALEERTLLSAAADSPLPLVSVASHPPVPSVAAVTSYVHSVMEQWGHWMAMVQQNVLGAWKTKGQEIAQKEFFVEQQWDHLLGINPSVQNPAPINRSLIDTTVILL